MKAHSTPPAESRLKQTVLLLIRNYSQHNVGKNAAALAYYLLFAIFPLLIFASNLLGLLKLDVYAITQTLSNFLPKDIVGLIESYLDYISHTSGHLLLWFSLVFSIWFPMRAVKGLMDDVRLAHHLSKPPNSLKYRLRQLIYTVVFLVVIILTLALSTLGEHVLGYIGRLLPENTPRISGFIPDFWQYLRFIPMALLMFAALGALYALSMDKRPPIKQILPGIIAALISWMVVSIGFSFYVENFAHYSLIYGTMGAMIVLLMWLYMTALVLILGAEFNAALAEIHS
ncbi:MAG: YihY/virulence factor BrkB family protein [Clostridia bacterium]|nr:YihY/virulence factor BrkB family protein [Clostridia bacterium]